MKNSLPPFAGTARVGCETTAGSVSTSVVAASDSRVAELLNTVVTDHRLCNAMTPARGYVGFDAARKLYEAADWRHAFDTFASLADQGDAAASKVALLMLRHRATLFRAPFDATPMQIARWAQRVLRASSRATASPSSMTANA